MQEIYLRRLGAQEEQAQKGRRKAVHRHYFAHNAHYTIMSA
jgi:hypothetical protein